jgi:hypothetical protein
VRAAERQGFGGFGASAFPADAGIAPGYQLARIPIAKPVPTFAEYAPEKPVSRAFGRLLAII